MIQPDTHSVNKMCIGPFIHAFFHSFHADKPIARQANGKVHEATEAAE